MKLYTISWTHLYAGWDKLSDQATELVLACSPMEESAMVIGYIMSL